MPASSYSWRNVIPYLSTLGRCIAVDLIGMGLSDKPNLQYTIDDHIRYIEKFIETLKLKNVTLVMHGWGSLIGFNYAMNHQENCKGLAFYEAYLRSFNGDDLSLPYQEQIAFLDKEENIVELITNTTYFIDIILPQSMMRPLTEEEMGHYRAPFLAEKSGKPLYQYLCEIPRQHGKGPVDKLIATYSKKLMESQLPKLMLYSIPGFITTMATVVWAKEHLPHIELIDVGEELHFAQESNPYLMAETISVWLQGIEHTSY
jgi:haloalkane dehalogenase